MRRSAPVAAAALAAWLLSAHTALNARLLRRAPPPDRAAAAPRKVSVLVPARDEAGRIGPCIRALTASRGIDLEVLVLDDRSSDGTAAAARAAAGADGRVRVLPGAPLPAGWLGKPHACAQLARAAAGDVLVFVDADVVVAPDGIAATVAALDEGRCDLVCPYPRQVADGLGPRLVQPLLQWSWLTFLPLRVAERWPRASLVAANGQLLACGADGYRAAGGHAAVRAAVLEDLELARAFVRAGQRAGVIDGAGLASCRMYAGWTELRAGYTKSLWAAFGSPAGAAAVLGLLAWLYLLPAATMLAGRGRARWIGALGYSGGVAGRVIAARRTGGRGGDALAHPASVAVLIVLTVDSLRLRAAGRLVWRGRPVTSTQG